MKKIIVALVMLGLFIRFVPCWPDDGVWVSKRTYLTTWQKAVHLYYEDKVQY
jgi:hypothetical protein